MDFEQLLKSRWTDVLVGDEMLRDIANATGPATILNTDLPSEDEDDDDFNDDEEEDDEEEGGAGPSAADRGDVGASTSAAAAAASPDGAWRRPRDTRGAGLASITDALGQLQQLSQIAYAYTDFGVGETAKTIKPRSMAVLYILARWRWPSRDGQRPQCFPCC